MKIKTLKKVGLGSFWLGCLILLLPLLSRKIYFSGIKKDIKSFYQSLNAVQDAKKIINQGAPYSIIGSGEADEIFENYKRGLEKALETDVEVLNGKYQELGHHFQNQYIVGLRLIIKGHETGGMQESLRGQRLLNEWDDWYIAGMLEIRKTLISPPFPVDLPSWILYTFAGISFLICGIVKILLSGNLLFWLKVRDHPDTAYDWFAINKDWVVLDPDTRDLYPKKDWTGPFLLSVPKLNGKIIKILGRARMAEKTQADFLKLIQSLEN